MTNPDLARALRDLATDESRAAQRGIMEQAADEIERLQRVLHDIANEWAGAECGEPGCAQEAEK